MGEPVRSKRVLVIDDNPSQLTILASLLSNNGFEVRTARDGPIAIDQLRDFIPDFALIDVGLPGMDGYELARHIREHSPKTVLIAVTGWTGQQHRTAALRAGFDVHLGKPFRFEQLKAVLQNKRP